MNDKADSFATDLSKIQDQFRQSWKNGDRPGISSFVEGIESSQQIEILRLLIPIDIEFRASTGELIDCNDYKSLGENAASIAAGFFSIDETPEPDNATLFSKQKNDPQSHSDSSPGIRTVLSEKSVIAEKYKLIHQIGAGGMGAVWLAQQENPVRRRVALKVIRSDLGSQETIARFEAERQALAMMNHPNIAQVLDAGTMDDGSPFFVMELVKGIPLTRYCNEHRLTIQQRLKLLVPVCHAVQHAHQKGIIHRDIKPSNILVSLQEDEPTPKVIDFGLAKALEHQNKLTDQTMVTEHGRVVGTLQYMSPEQAGSNELDVDARTDIYSIGVILYQLLTGTTPLDRETIANNTLLQLIEIICDSEIQRPSVRLQKNAADLLVTGKQRKIEPKKLIQELHGELDWIAMKALEKDRTDRYQTATGLADDLQRFIDNEPVSARPPSTSYLLKKFINKHRGLVASVLTATALLIAGICASTYFAISAEKLRNRSASQLEVYMDSFASTDPLRGAKKNMTAVDVLQQAEKNLGQKLEDDPIGRASMLHEIGKSYRGQSRLDLAISALSQAFELRKVGLGMNNLDTLESHAQMAIAYQRKDPEKMLGILEDVYQRKAKLLSKTSVEMMASQRHLGTAFLFAYKELKKRGISKPEYIDRAVDVLNNTFETQRATLGMDHNETLSTLTNLANAHLKKGNVAQSIELGKQAIAGWQDKIDRGLKEEDKNASLASLLQTQNNFAEALKKNGQLGDAIEVFKQTMEQKARLLDIGHGSWLISVRLLLDTMVENQQFNDARQLFELTQEQIESQDNSFDKGNVLKKLSEIQSKIMDARSIDENWHPN